MAFTSHKMNIHSATETLPDRSGLLESSASHGVPAGFDAASDEFIVEFDEPENVVTGDVEQGTAGEREENGKGKVLDYPRPQRLREELDDDVLVLVAEEFLPPVGDAVRRVVELL